MVSFQRLLIGYGVKNVNFYLFFNYAVLKYVLKYNAPVWGMADHRYTSLQQLQNKYLEVISKLPWKPATKA
jgi:hypothetical protein